MESPAPNPGPSRTVGVVLLGSGPAPGRTALGRLLARLGAAGVVDPPLVRFAAGGGPGAPAAGAADELELPASGDAGRDLTAAASALGERFGCELLVVVTGPIDARVEECLDEYSLLAPRALDAIVGWIEPAAGGARSPRLGGGLLLVPRTIVERLAEPPAGGLQAVRRGVGSMLRRGGRFDVETPFGERTRELGIAVVDLRVVSALRAARIGLAAIDEKLRGELVGSRGLARRVAPRSGREHWLDEVRIPEELAHGEVGEIRLRGWVVGDPEPQRVEVTAAGSVVARGGVRVRRPDVRASRPELGAEACGFDIVAGLGPFSPGGIDVGWAVDGGPPGGTLGEVRIVPVHRLVLDRILIPVRGAETEAQAVRVEGRVLASSGGVEVEAEIDGRPLETSCPEPRPGTDPARPVPVSFVAAAKAVGLGRGQVRLVVRSRDGSGATARAERQVELAIDPEARQPLVFERREVGCHDPVTGRTGLWLSGVAFGIGAAERLVLRSEGRDLVELALAPLSPGEPPAASFEADVETDALPPGEHGLELVRLDARGEATVASSWRATVEPLAARALDVAVAAEPSGGSGSLHRLVVEGGLEAADRVESLALAVDGRVEQRLGAEWLRHDETSGDPQAGARRRFRFDGALPLAPGGHQLEIRVRRGAAELPVWRGELEVEPAPPADTAVGIACDELDRLLREDPAPVWSRLVLDGRVVGAPRGTTVRLSLGDRVAATAAVAADGSFRLAARPPEGEIVEGRVELEAAGRSLAKASPFRIATRRLDVTERAVAELGELVDRLFSGAGRRGLEPREALLGFLERAPGEAGRRLSSVSELVAAAREAERRPARIVEAPPRKPERRLRVLLACWEIPCSRHGGGVTMLNLLRFLGGRHDVTLIHSLAPGEEDLIEEVRPFLRDILPVRREWRPEAPDREFGVPEAMARNSSPAIRHVVEAEAATGRFDLVNYEFNPMALHAAPLTAPAFGVLHEVHALPELDGAPARLDDPELAAAWLERMVGALEFEARIAPRRFGELATLTRPEAEVLAPWLPGRRIFVSPIPIDVERFAPTGAPAPGAPTFVFVGNYIHPPNRDAARALAEEVAPALLERRSDLRMVLAGPHPPEALRALARPPGLQVAGFVPDLLGLLHGARGFLAPIRSGGGLRVKLLEAMAAGCPVVSTRLGFNGIPVTSGSDALVAETDAELVEAALRLAGDEQFALRLGAAGRRLVEREFGLETLGERRERIWQAVLDGDAG